MVKIDKNINIHRGDYLRTNSIKLFFAERIHKNIVKYLTNNVTIYRHKETGDYYLDKDTSSRVFNIFSDEEDESFKPDPDTNGETFLLIKGFENKYGYKSIKGFEETVDNEVTCLFDFEHPGFISVK